MLWSEQGSRLRAVLEMRDVEATTGGGAAKRELAQNSIILVLGRCWDEERVEECQPVQRECAEQVLQQKKVCAFFGGCMFCNVCCRQTLYFCQYFAKKENNCRHNDKKHSTGSIAWRLSPACPRRLSSSFMPCA